jgi:PKD repeat protein
MALLASVPATAAPNQAPIANAGPDRTGTVNVPLTLSGSGSYDPDGSVAAYWWQFGDGSAVATSSSSVSHTWTAAGVYSVTLWVRDAAWVWSAAPDVAQVTIGGGATTTTTTQPVTTTTAGGTNKVPTADAGPNQATQTLLSLTFNGSGSRDPDGTIALASWSFGDGTSAPGLVVSHSYGSAGTYVATLSVIDNRGALDTDTATITVANRAPTANAGPDLTGTAGAAVTLNGSGSSDLDGTITGWAWTFGDGTTGTGAVASHVYTAAGTYTARLTVTDNEGASASDTAVVTVTAAASATWARKVGSTSSDGGYAIQGDAAGNTIVGGAFRGSTSLGGVTLSSAGGSDGFVIKYSPTGAVVWARSVGGSGDDAIEALAVDEDGDVVVAARFVGTASFGGTSLVANGPGDMAVAKYGGANGAHQWSKRFGGSYDDAASAIAVDGANNVYFTGYFRGTASFGGASLSVPFTNDLDVFLVKLTPAGAHVWSKNFANDGNERGYGIAADAAGNVAITGSFSNTVNFGGANLTSQNAMTDVFVARFTTNGAHSWSRRFGASDGNESGCGAAMDTSGNVLVTGYALKPVDFGGGTLSALGGTDGFVAKYGAASGSHMWSRRLGGAGNDYGYGVAVDGANNVLVAGSFAGLASFGGISLPLLGASDAFVAKYGSSGNLVWARGLGGIDAEVGRAVGVAGGTPVSTGYFSGSGLFSGTTLSSSGMSDAFVTRLAP